MSWPIDGFPRYYVTSISGQRIPPDAAPRFANRAAFDREPTQEFYVLDRADCHRIVLTVPASQRLQPSKAKALAERVCERLNAV